MEISKADLTAYAVANNERLDLVLDEDDPDPTYFLSEASEEFTAFLRDHELYLDGETIHFDPSQFTRIEQECNAIVDEYDSDRVIDGSLWNAYGLQGDDDVDYNGGYILIFIDLLKDYVQNHK